MMCLEHLGFSTTALKWISSYLVGHSQCVVDKMTNTKSKFVRVNDGVPQGLVLGPLPLSLFIVTMLTFVPEISSPLSSSFHERDATPIA
ncbi:hypothetical protein PV326_009458 [Microctonus aethiopoides]|nr:hypothetical protein PV326_009458 [Microctonus aethiopoides]